MHAMEGISIGNEKMLILTLTANSTKDVPDLNEYPFFPGYTSANPIRVFKTYIAGEMW